MVRPKRRKAINERDASDNCETPKAAYKDVVDVLGWLAEKRNKAKKDLLIYDPYYCAGRVKKHLASLGFTNVYNKDEDFYTAAVPEYDVLVTNPPYSGDHLDRLLRFCSKSAAPWLLLLPNYVYTNSYFSEHLHQKEIRPFYIVPFSRYVYTSPAGLRSTRESKTSPWVSFW